MRKLFGFVLFLLALTGCAYIYALYFFIPEQITSRFAQVITRSGFDHVKYSRVSATGGAVGFHEVALDENGFGSVERVDVLYSPIGYIFSGGGANTIRVRNLRLTGELSENYELTLAGWQIESGFLKKLATLSADTVLIESSAVDLLSPHLGGLKFEFEGQIRRAPGKTSELTFIGRIKSRQSKLAFDSSITGTLSENGLLEITSKADELQIDLRDLKVNRASAEINFMKLPDSAPSIAMRGPAASVKWKSLPFGDVNFVVEHKDGDFNLFAEGKTQGPEKIDFSVGIKSSGQETNYDIVATPETFSLVSAFLLRNGLLKEGQPVPPLLANLKAPSLSLSFNDTIGTQPDTAGTWSLEAEEQGLSIEGDFFRKPDTQDVWSARCNKASFTEEGEEGSMAPPFFIEIPMACGIEWDGSVKPPKAVWSIRTDIKGEELHFGPVRLINITGLVGEQYLGDKYPDRRSVLSYTLPLKKDIPHKGQIKLNLDATGAGLIKSLDLSIYGGLIRAENFDLKGLSFPTKMTFKISDIDLAAYLGGLKISRLVAYGRMGGVLPLIKRKNGLTIKDGLLQSQEPGIIKMPESLSVTLFPGTDPQMTAIRQALKNYHYEFFELRLDGTVSSGVMISLNSRGTNPDMKDKKPIEMNLQIETQIGLLVEHMLAK